MTMIGFEQTPNGQIKEYLPASEQLLSDREKRVMFFNLFNAYCEKGMKFTKKEIERGDTIYEVFQNKIDKLLYLSSVYTALPIHRNNIFGWKVSRTISDFPGKNMQKIINPNVSLVLVEKWIRLISGESGYRFLADLDDMFLHLVYERAKLVNKHNEVLLFEKSIVIVHHDENVSNTLLIPSYRMIDKNNLQKDPSIAKQMQTVFDTLNTTDIRQVYLVYPKHATFKKHINIKVPHQVLLNEEDYRVKVVPYSFSFCSK